MGTKRALVLVSRGWYLAGINFLYRHITLRRPLALVSFLNTLTEAQPHLGGLVRSITFMTYVPPLYSREVSDYMVSILKLCPIVTSVSDLPPFVLPRRLILPFLPSTVTTIKLSPSDHIDDIHRIITQKWKLLQTVATIKMPHNPGNVHNHAQFLDRTCTD
ncbi:hypothetical protein B0H17DRAFT_1130633 [Mycena rosella]|uniref:Uncharacterized protein n=1 Tax=Mycena rosella TaxID=1033263 RepID=A0AAD7DQX1_MYCRO|nr:hypothetical protein B0H17DRAFT_1130633 [Mycena rosella]